MQEKKAKISYLEPELVSAWEKKHPQTSFSNWVRQLVMADIHGAQHVLAGEEKRLSDLKESVQNGVQTAKRINELSALENKERTSIESLSDNAKKALLVWGRLLKTSQQTGSRQATDSAMQVKLAIKKQFNLSDSDIVLLSEKLCFLEKKKEGDKIEQQG